MIKKKLNLRKEKETVAIQSSIVQVHRHTGTFTVVQKLGGEIFFQNTAQLDHFLYGLSFSPLNLARCRGGTKFTCLNAAVVGWRNDFKGGARRGGAN